MRGVLDSRRQILTRVTRALGIGSPAVRSRWARLSIGILVAATQLVIYSSQAPPSLANAFSASRAAGAAASSIVGATPQAAEGPQGPPQPQLAAQTPAGLLDVGLQAPNEPATLLRPHEVFGLAPYRTVPEQASFDVSNLSTIAYFGVDLTADGLLVTTGSGWSGFQSRSLDQLIARAHRTNTRVVLVVKSFDPAVLHALSTDPAADARLGTQLATAVASRAMDGVNLDFEGPGSGDRVGFTSFVRTLARASSG